MPPCRPGGRLSMLGVRAPCCPAASGVRGRCPACGCAPHVPARWLRSLRFDFPGTHLQSQNSIHFRDPNNSFDAQCRRLGTCIFDTPVGLKSACVFPLPPTFITARSMGLPDHAAVLGGLVECLPYSGNGSCLIFDTKATDMPPFSLALPDWPIRRF